MMLSVWEDNHGSGERYRTGSLPPVYDNIACVLIACRPGSSPTLCSYEVWVSFTCTFLLQYSIHSGIRDEQYLTTG